MNEVIRNLQLDILATEAEVLNLKQELLEEIDIIITEIGIKSGDEFVIEDLDEFVINELKKLHARSTDYNLKSSLLKIEYDEDLKVGKIKFEMNKKDKGVK